MADCTVVKANSRAYGERAAMSDKVARGYLFEEMMFEKKLKEGEIKSLKIWGAAPQAVRSASEKDLRGEHFSCVYRMFRE